MYHILVVDDEIRIRSIVRKYAEFEGHTVTEAGDALLRISHDSFCAVDLAMFADLTDEELFNFTETLGRLQAAVTALAPERKEQAE